MTVIATIPNTLPPVLIAVSDEVQAAVATLDRQAASALAQGVTDATTMAAADALVAEAIRLDKAIEADRKRLKAPVLALAAALDEAASDARTPLLGIKQDLGRAILAWQQEENRRREEIRRQLEEARCRQEEEAAAARAAAAAAQVEEPAPWDDAPAPVHVPEVIAPTYEQQQAAAPIKSSSVVAKRTKRIEITDPAQVPREVAGVPLWIIDAKAVEKLAKAGIAIPGVTVTEVETLAAKG
jgi:hypothetical protein